MTLNLQQIAEIIGVETPTHYSTSPYSILLTDSRSLSIPENTIFFALHTPYNDGHNYIKDLYLNGVRAFVIEHTSEITEMCTDATFLVVPSVLAALQKLGAYAAKQFAGKIIAITGSTGKSTIKEMLYQALLKSNQQVFRSPRSWNSQIGVPLSLWKMADQKEGIAIIEAGIDGMGQMDALRNMICPTVGILTPITDEHSAGFNSLLDKVSEKALLFKNCQKVYAICDDSCYSRLKEIYPDKEIANSVPTANFTASYTRALHDVLSDLGFSGEECQHLLSDLYDVDTRIDVSEGVNNCVMVYDTFSCDYTSIHETLDFARRRATSDRTLTVIMGDILHSNRLDNSVVADLYTAVANLLDRYGVKRLIGIGSEINKFRTCFNPVMANEFIDQASVDIHVDVNNFSDELIVLKGTHGVDFNHIKEQLEAPRHDSIVEVNLDAIVHNFNHYRSLLKPKTGIVAMVKASGYGVGALELAKTLQSQGAAYLAVAVVDEGVALRQAGITMPIMVMNPMTTNYRALFEYRLEPSVFSISELQQLHFEAKLHNMSEYPIHIKLDTGMHRLGFLSNELTELCEALADEPYLRVASVFSHLATADCLDMDKHTLAQLNLFDEMSTTLLNGISYKFKRHILNTAGIQRFPQFQYDMVRLGIGLYGINPAGTADAQDLRNVARLRSTIISLKKWPADTHIGYSRKGCTTAESIIATVPIGYADGIDRHLGNGAASFVVNGVKCPTIGNICMDLCMVDVTGANAKLGDDVEIFGPNAPIETLSETLKTIPYEILTSVSPRVKRIYFRE
jgi:alanine racemase